MSSLSRSARPSSLSSISSDSASFNAPVSSAPQSSNSASSAQASSAPASSAPPPSSSSQAPPSSSPPPPPSSASSLPISSSSVAPSSSSVASSSSAPSSLPPSSSSAASSASLTTLTSASRATSQSQVVLTSGGQTFTSFVITTQTFPAGSAITSTPTPQPSSHTGAIVGGVIGGVAFLGILAGALFWYRRHQNRQDQTFDGNFDPVTGGGGTRPVSGPGPEMVRAHTTGGTLPSVGDVDDDGMGGRLPIVGGVVTPFTYTPTVSASTRSQSPPMPRGSPPPMSQYSQEGYPPTLSSAGGYYSAVPQQAQAVGGYYPPAAPSSSGSSVYHPRSVKEQEAAGGSPRAATFSVANPSPESAGDSRPLSAHEEQYQAYLRAGPSSRRYSQPQSSNPPLLPTGPSSGVIVHQDGGRLEEIPPTYDSIPN
ncbi:hypothetical protein FB45DRAFT_1003929 [Roridomyces roridus]|uniref:Uncharacterized protein n=1 Tax=Roridomyces roridus TaxID=1738132 RepID=A0AAD7BUT3_9AGAR|nr:hypothetical protein FB45DRAFT_1003929 [Roridomyces roridus]